MPMNKIITSRHLVMPKDLNPANRLFGGQMMAWIDEAAAMYAMCQARTQYLVTAKVSEVNFTEPVEQGDFLTFEAEMIKVGTKSFTVCVTVKKKYVDTGYEKEACHCFLTFVTVDRSGTTIPHGIKWKEDEKAS